MKRSLRLGAVLLCMIAPGIVTPALAVDWKALKPQGYVSDFAGVVDARSKAELESYAARVQQATQAQLAFVTIPSLQGEPIEDVANDLFHAWGIGRKGEDDGALVLLAIQDHKSRLEVGGGLGGAVPDGMAGLLLDDMRPALRQNQYGAAFLAAAERLGSTIAQSKGVTIAAPAPLYRVRPSVQDSIPWPLILFGVFFLLLLLRGGGNRFGGGGGGGGGFWTGLLLGQLLGGGRGGFGGGRDGGGFGGFDSGGGGGGFGGFGGGDSGGGGASSDW
ncbi:MAG TPA: TPM domain-containing protein [Bryobacteraceae bacterium]|jgi:uncharacterized protein|nr:TPM domain-containing protein [Bryobacteraceae bacterium]